MTQKTYSCVFVNDGWHCTQEQAAPPVYRRGSNDGGWTICSLWGEFIRGFDKRRPTCNICLKAIEYDEEHFPEPVKSDVKRPRKNREDVPDEHEAGSALPVERTDVPVIDSGNP